MDKFWDFNSLCAMHARPRAYSFTKGHQIVKDVRSPGIKDAVRAWKLLIKIFYFG